MSGRRTAAERLSAGQKAGLGWEIVRLRMQVARAMRHTDARNLVGTMRTRRRRGHTPLTSVGIERLARAVGLVLGRLPGDQRCLARSLVLVGLLAERGVSSTLVIGVDTPDREFKAHAWVEVDGVAVLPDEGYSRLTEL